MTVREATVDDVDRIVLLLALRRGRLVRHAPIFWRPADDAGDRHRDFLAFLLGEAGARAWVDGDAVLVAARRGEGWLVDDLAVSSLAEARELWAAFAGVAAGDPVRVVAPTYDAVHRDLAAAEGLELVETWWLRELPDSGGGVAGVGVALPAAVAVTVAAPPVYAPPGPVLLVTGPDVSEATVRAAAGQAVAHGCAAVVVGQVLHGPRLDVVLHAEGFRRHCEFHEGVVRSA